MTDTKTTREGTRWYHNDDRPCLGDDRFADSSALTKGHGRTAEVQHLKELCMYRCPVLNECAADMLQWPDEAHAGTIRAGREFPLRGVS